MTASPLMKTCRLFALLAAAAVSADAEPILPVVEGTVWEYGRTESGAGAAEQSNATVRLAGTENLNGQQLLKLETSTANQLTKTELISVNDDGILCFRRTMPDGQTVSFDPPQPILKAPLQVGAKWEIDGEVAGAPMRQAFTVVGEEDVVVPAGKFRAFRLRCEQPWPVSISVERWFTPGTGFIKDVTTTRGPGGRLLSRVTLLLQKVSVLPPPQQGSSATTPAPEAAPTVGIGKAPSDPAASPASETPSPQMTIEVAAEREGPLHTEFKSDAPNIFVRWAGQNLPSGATVRIAWVTEDVGDIAPPDFVIDETESVVTMPELKARFTLSRPLDGWAAGKYRVELYLDNLLMQELKVTIRD